jgi:GT2 family glycosyltransferase
MARLEVAVIIASTGRPANLATALRHFSNQSQSPAAILLSVASQEDLPPDLDAYPDVAHVIGPKGLPAQRNTGLRNLGADADIVAFFDDDYIPTRCCIEHVAAFFAANPDVAGANGLLLADGINTAGIATEQAEELISRHDAAATALDTSIRRDLKGLYGCNMTYRRRMIEGIWFDERLKLYGWQEDIDFAAQLLGRGRLVQTHAFAGVHQGVKGGRASGVRLGYSQIINPLYLAGKGTMRTSFALRIIMGNLVANHARALSPEPWVDRAGRVRGNWLGLFDAVRGRLTPERIEAL